MGDSLRLSTDCYAGQGGCFHMAKHSFSSLMRRLAQAGFKRPFITAALLPDWWDNSYAKDPDVLPDIEIRIARFLNLPLSTIRNADTALAAPSYDGAQLRKLRNIDRVRLSPAIHAAVRVADAVVRNLRCEGSADIPPTGAQEWRSILMSRQGGPVQLHTMLCDLWERRIPVVPLETLPSPGFQALACVVEGHPIVMLGHKYDEPGRVAFLAAHEVGHIVAGDCTTDIPVMHDSEAVFDESPTERAADKFASQVLIGETSPEIPGSVGLDPKTLAQWAVDNEMQTGAEATAIIYSWAARTLNYPQASLAVQALYRSKGARREMVKQFFRFVDVEGAPESDMTLLRCVHGKSEPASAVG